MEISRMMQYGLTNSWYSVRKSFFSCQTSFSRLVGNGNSLGLPLLFLPLASQSALPKTAPNAQKAGSIQSVGTRVSHCPPFLAVAFWVKSGLRVNQQIILLFFDANNNTGYFYFIAFDSCRKAKSPYPASRPIAGNQGLMNAVFYENDTALAVSVLPLLCTIPYSVQSTSVFRIALAPPFSFTCQSHTCISVVNYQGTRCNFMQI